MRCLPAYLYDWVVEPRPYRAEMSRVKGICSCGRAGEVEDREPGYLGEGKHALRWPYYGHLEDLSWLSADTQERILEESAHRRLEIRRLTAQPTV
jgi:hypothetical protein